MVGFLKKQSNTNDSAGNRIFKGIVWNFLGLLFNKGFAMVASIFVARYLGTLDFGRYGMINSTISTFATFAGLGLGITATKFIAEFKDIDKDKVGKVLGLTNLFGLFSGLIMMLVVYIGADWLAVNQLKSIEMKKFFQISAVMLLLNTINEQI